jgi:ABC-2 type transport system ATP-binding protein
VSSQFAISVRDLEKDYGDVQALRSLSLDVGAGQFFGLLGPNGAGKTTFINVLVGLVNRTGGEARVFGADVTDDYRQVRDRIGIAPQEFNVDRFFPTKEVLMHKAGYHGVDRAEAADRADEVLRTVGIYEKRNTKFTYLSGGMKRRFVLARALVSEPDLLILDEPTAGVDVELRRDLWRIITELNDEGTTVLLTTHYIEEAEQLCDEVAIMAEGRKIAVASPAELTQRGTDTLRILLDETPSGVPDIDESGLENGSIEDIAVEGREVVVTAKRANAVAPELVRRLDRAGYQATNLDIEPASLEEVFVDLTSHDADDADEGEDESGETDADAQRLESPEATT